MRARWLLMISLAAGLPAPDASAAEAGLDPGVACDQLAAHPEDLDRTSPGRVMEDVDLDAAEAACRKAVEAHPDERRYLYQLGRTLHGKKDLQGALKAYEAAAAKG